MRNFCFGTLYSGKIKKEIKWAVVLILESAIVNKVNPCVGLSLSPSLVFLVFRIGEKKREGPPEMSRQVQVMFYFIHSFIHSFIMEKNWREVVMGSFREHCFGNKNIYCLSKFKLT